jgi:histidinol dehydrogenase
MTVVLAQIARCPEIAVFTPCGPDGRVAPAMLGALHKIGIDEVYRIGGVQAVGAMAYGTESIRPVDKVFGPGNAYTVEAQRQVFGTVGVALLPGPSEVCVIADSSAKAEFVAADILAQAEHGTGREKVYFITTSEKVLQEVEAEIERQITGLGRAKLIQSVLDTGALAIVTDSLAEAAEIADFIAPEHLELEVAAKSVAGLLRRITTAGAVLVGGETPTALGDFIAGPSHTLPTGRTGRFFSGLRVSDFLRRTSVVRYDARSLAKAAPVVAAFSGMENLDAHGRSCEIRLKRPRPRIGFLSTTAAAIKLYQSGGFGVAGGIVATSRARVAPHPPAASSQRAKSTTNRDLRRCEWTLSRMAPVPLPWIIRTVLKPRAMQAPR